MLKCSLSKNKSYDVQEVIFNSSQNSYQLKLANPPSGCESGVFSNKKMELKIVPDNKEPYLHFNHNDAAPELVLSSLTIIRKATSFQNHASTTHSSSVDQASPTPPAQQTGHFSFLYILIAIVAIVLLVKFLVRQKNSEPPYTNNNNQNPYNANLPTQPNGPYSDPNAPYNSQPPYQNANSPYGSQQPTYPNAPYNPNYPQQQGPSKTGSFVSGLAGGVVGAVAGNALYDAFKGNSSAQASPNINNNTSNNDNDTFSSDNSFGNDNSFSNDDDDDTFSSDD